MIPCLIGWLSWKGGRQLEDHQDRIRLVNSQTYSPLSRVYLFQTSSLKPLHIASHRAKNRALCLPPPSLKKKSSLIPLLSLVWKFWSLSVFFLAAWNHRHWPCSCHHHSSPISSSLPLCIFSWMLIALQWGAMPHSILFPPSLDFHVGGQTTANCAARPPNPFPAMPVRSPPLPPFFVLWNDGRPCSGWV